MPAHPSSRSLRPCRCSWIERPAPGAYLLVDEFSTIFLVLINFVSFTTSVFSATYVAHEVETGRVTPGLPAGSITRSIRR